MKRMDLAPIAVVACCVLHNICLKFDDNEWIKTLLTDKQPNLCDDTTIIPAPIENTLSGCMKTDQIMLALTRC